MTSAVSFFERSVRILKMYTIINICTLCFKNHANIKNIANCGHNRSIEHKLRFLIEHVETKTDDIQICQNCVDNLTTAYNFKYKCLQNIKRFNNYVSVLKKVHETKQTNQQLKVNLIDLKFLPQNSNQNKTLNTTKNTSTQPGCTLENGSHAIQTQNNKFAVKVYNGPNFLNINKEQQCATTQIVDNLETTQEKDTSDIDSIDNFEIIDTSEIKLEDNFTDGQIDFTQSKNESNIIEIQGSIVDNYEIKQENDLSDIDAIVDNCKIKLENDTDSNTSEINLENVQTYTNLTKHDLETELNCFDDQQDVLKDELQYEIIDDIVKEEPDISEDVDSNFEDLKELLKNETATNEETSDRRFKCTQCPKTFNKRWNFIMHSRHHSGVRNYKCEQCDKAFITSQDRDRHSVTHTKLKPYVCEICGVANSTSGALARHKKTHNPPDKIYKCGLCDRGFREKRCLQNHIQTHSDVKLHTCNVCGKKFRGQRNLNAHKLIHSDFKKYSCDLCDKKCRQSYELVQHKRRHTGEKTFVCDVCNKAFISSNELKLHSVTHTKEKKFQCDICPKKYGRNDQLTLHKRTHNLTT